MFRFFKKKMNVPVEVDEKHSAYPNDTFNHPEEIFELFTQVTGMHFYKKEKITAEKMRNFCLRYKIGGFLELKERVANEPAILQALIDYLTVNETYFFRELEQIDILKERLLKTASPIRILCAPCATGEEVYSIIIRFLEAGIPKERFEIMGIDINASAIEWAVEGNYTGRSVNRIESELLQKYFTQEKEHYRIIPSVRKLADFRLVNIFDKAFSRLGSFDVIFSRNLFIYFDEEQKKKAVDIFCSLLRSKGLMFFGHADNFNDPVCLESEFVGRTRVYTKKESS